MSRCDAVRGALVSSIDPRRGACPRSLVALSRRWMNHDGVNVVVVNVVGHELCGTQWILVITHHALVLTLTLHLVTIVGRLALSHVQCVGHGIAGWVAEYRRMMADIRSRNPFP